MLIYVIRLQMEAQKKMREAMDCKRTNGKTSEQKLGLESPIGSNKMNSLPADKQRVVKKNLPSNVIPFSIIHAACFQIS